MKFDHNTLDSAENASYGAHDLRNEAHATSAEKTYGMYSYNRIADTVLMGMAYNMVERGFTEDEIRDVLVSKEVRRGLDLDNSKLLEVGYEIAKGFSKVKG